MAENHTVYSFELRLDDDYVKFFGGDDDTQYSGDDDIMTYSEEEFYTGKPLDHDDEIFGGIDDEHVEDQLWDIADDERIFPTNDIIADADEDDVFQIEEHEIDKYMKPRDNFLNDEPDPEFDDDLLFQGADESESIFDIDAGVLPFIE